MEGNFLADQEAPQGLLNKVVSRLEQERRLRSLRQRLVFVMFSFAALLTIVWPVWHNFWLDWQNAGLVDYLSLLMSDAKIVLANWQNFSLGFLESFPVVSTMAVLSVLLAMLVALRLTCKYSQEFLAISHWSKQNN